MKCGFANRCFCLLALATILLQSCGNDPAPGPKAGQSGFFVVNEGAFGNGNSSLSFYDRRTDAMSNNIFSTKNGRPLGDQAQSMTLFDGKGYVVVQNSSKVEVINIDDFSSVGTIVANHPGPDDLQSPRFFVGITPTKGYVSDWGADGLTGTVKVVDLQTFKVTKTIPTGLGANRMLKVNNLVYVTNSGGYGNDNTIKLIESGLDLVSSTITVGDNPNSLQRDKEGNIWVACSGKIVFNTDFSINTTASTKGSLIKLSPTNTEMLRLTVDKFTYSTMANLNISPDGATLYYTFDDKIFSMPISSSALPTQSFKDGSYYGLAVDPFNGSVIGCLAPSFSAAGSIDVFNAKDSLIGHYDVGIGPNGCAFK
jgi:sugar lactone lactonase YvrE